MCLGAFVAILSGLSGLDNRTDLTIIFMSFRYLSNDPIAVAGDEGIIVTTTPGIDWPVPGKPHNTRRQSQKKHKSQRLPEGNGGDTKKRRDNDVPGHFLYRHWRQ